MSKPTRRPENIKLHRVIQPRVDDESRHSKNEAQTEHRPVLFAFLTQNCGNGFVCIRLLFYYRNRNQVQLD
jgi:hypothetical protein